MPVTLGARKGPGRGEGPREGAAPHTTPAHARFGSSESLRRRVGGYGEWAPPGGLAPCVSAIWCYRTPKGGSPEHRVLPHAGIDLAVVYSADEGAQERQPQLVLLGPVRTPRVFRPADGMVMASIQLRPEWSRTLLAVAPEEHLDAQRGWSDLRAADGPSLAPLGSSRTARPRAALALLVEWLGKRWEEGRLDAASRLAHAALRRLRRPGGAGRVRSVAGTLGVSERHLRRVVRDVTGSAPKALQRLERLNAAVSASDAVVRPRWTFLSDGAGYFDQAHMIREFRTLTGTTPARLHRERRAQRVRFVQSSDEVAT